MASHFFTNQPENTLFKKFQNIVEKNQQLQFFDALTAYFYASGYFALQPYLKDMKQVRVLVGINLDTLIQKAERQGNLWIGSRPEETLEIFQKHFQSDVQNAPYQQNLEQGILDLIADVQSKRVQMKIHPSQKIHAKFYLFLPENYSEHTSGSLITGSSNFTAAGLGIAKPNVNYELDIELRDYDDVKFVKEEFERLWQEGVAIANDDLEEPLKQTHLRTDVTAKQLYYKLLIEYFGGQVEVDNSLKIPEGLKELTYQKDAVAQGMSLLKKHNGFFLADVVGLGKTVIASMIAQKFFYENGYPEYQSRTLIITPPAVESAWKETIEKFDLGHVEYITTGSLHKVKNPKKYDLILVDEAHKFRNDAAQMYHELQKICKTKTRKETRKYVILISATPLNNRPEDLRNLIYLFQDSHASTLDISFDQFFQQTIKEYKGFKKSLEDLEKQNPPPNDKAVKQTEFEEKLKKLYEEIRQKVMMPLTVRRTRADLTKNSQYKEDLEKQSIVFPDVKLHDPLYYQMDQNLNNLFDNSLQAIQKLNYTRWRAVQYLVPDQKDITQKTDIPSKLLAHLIKVLLTKRLDSSFHSFFQTLQRLEKANQQMIKMYHNNQNLDWFRYSVK